jgi:hypothetical protein
VQVKVQGRAQLQELESVDRARRVQEPEQVVARLLAWAPVCRAGVDRCCRSLALPSTAMRIGAVRVDDPACHVRDPVDRGSRRQSFQDRGIRRQ